MTRILVTGAAGMIGRALLSDLAGHEIIATDLKAPADLPAGVRFEPLDVTGEDPDRVIGETRPEVVVHLASIVTPGPGLLQVAILSKRRCASCPQSMAHSPIYHDELRSIPPPLSRLCFYHDKRAAGDE